MSEPILSRRGFLTLLASIPIWVSVPSGLVRAATLLVGKLGLRTWSAPDHTRLVLVIEIAQP